MKKHLRITSLALVFTMVLSIFFITPIAGTGGGLYEIDETPWDGIAVATSFAYGVGSEENPYVIASAAQFVYLRNSVNAGESYSDKYFILACNINLGGFGWTPIGTTEALSFLGLFDGCDYTISNYKINVTTKSDQGLFGYITSTGTLVENLRLANAQITSTASGSCIGALAGYIKGARISSITVENDVTVTANAGSAGGVAGRIVTNSIAEYCINNASVSASSSSKNAFAGGICGAVGESATLRYCANNGNVTVDRIGNTYVEYYAGGIAGLMGVSSSGGTIDNCYNSGTITCPSATGGIIGKINTSGNLISNSYNLSENISGDVAYSGSIIGWLRYVSTFTGNIGVTVSGLGLYGTDVAVAQTDLTGFTQGTIATVQKYTLIIDVLIDTKMAVISTNGTASVRITTDYSTSGLRFESTVNKSFYDAVVSAYGQNAVEVITIIAPTSFVSEATAFTKEALDAFKISASKQSDTYKTIVSSSPYKTESNTYTFSGSIVNIISTNFNLSFSAISYIIVGEECYYSSVSTSRSISQVANSALNDVMDTQSGEYNYVVQSGIYAGKYSPYSAAQRSILDVYAN